MPLESLPLDNRRYQDIKETLLARIPVHTPEWTNYQESDPGVALVEVFAFLAETMLYRANQVPERNRRKFLQLLGVPLHAGSSARGIITIANERGPVVTLDRDLEVRAGQVPFRTRRGLDVLPVEAHVCFKRKIAEQPPEKREYYRQLYASFLDGEPTDEDVELYELVPLEARGTAGVNVGSESVDQALWIALLARKNEPLDDVRRAIAGKTLSIGLVPRIESEDARRRLAALGVEAATNQPVRVEMPNIPDGGKVLPGTDPAYRTVATLAMPVEPAVFEVPLPGFAQLGLWQDLDPLELGSDKYPPTLDDTALDARVITWLRLVWPDGVASQLVWAGINATTIAQRTHVANELLPEGNGEPDQSATLTHSPVLPDSVKLTITTKEGESEPWQFIDDLLAAGSEVPATDLREPPGRVAPPPRPAKVFALDAEAGRIRFGDGARGARPPLGATLRVSYDYGSGRAGNVGEKAVNQAPALPAGLKVLNPVRTWGGAESESVTEGERQVPRYLQHRDRLVTVEDFETIARRTPGVDLGRVEVLAAYNPSLPRQEPGNAPGAVTLMLIPKYSATRPDAPSPDQAFLSVVCAYLDPRRLVTTELFLQGPDYVPIWISVALEIVAVGAEPDAPNSTAIIREAVKRRVREFLAPIRDDGGGWPLRQTVQRLALMAEVSRVPGVALVNELLLAAGDGSDTNTVSLTGLQLPRLDGIEVAIGATPLPLDQLRGAPGPAKTDGKRIVPVPVIPKEC